MKIGPILAVILVLLIATVSCSSRGNKNENIIDFNSLRVIKKNYSNLNDAGKIKKIVKLETTAQSLIGRIDRVVVDPKTGDLLIGDFRNTKRVLRFTNQGRFIRTYGSIGEGPGEYINLTNFTVTDSGDVILICNLKIIRYAPDGALIRESRLGYDLEFIECIDDTLYLTVLRYNTNPGKKHAIMAVNPFFLPTGGIADYDRRLERHLFLPFNALTRQDNHLYFTDLYDLNLNIYDTKTQQLKQLLIPNQNSILDKIWKKKRLTQEDDQQILIHLHRFQNILSCGNRLFLAEMHNEKKVYNIWLLDLEKKELQIFSRFCLTGDFREKVKKDLFFYIIPGSYDKGIIGVFNDDIQFNLHKEKYPILKDVEFGAEDNPILAFFQFHK